MLGKGLPKFATTTTVVRAKSDKVAGDVTSPRKPALKPPPMPGPNGEYPIGTQVPFFRIPGRKGALPCFCYHGTCGVPPEVGFREGLQSRDKVPIDPENEDELNKAFADHHLEEVPDDEQKSYLGRLGVSFSKNAETAAFFGTTNHAAGWPRREDGVVFTYDIKKMVDDGWVVVDTSHMSPFRNEDEVTALYQAPGEYAVQAHKVSPDPGGARAIFDPQAIPNPHLGESGEER